MEIRELLHWLGPVLFILAGVGLVFVRIDEDQLREKTHSNPGLALYRFRVFRYGAAVVLFVIAAISFFESSR
jgi:hypothetical protein